MEWVRVLEGESGRAETVSAGEAAPVMAEGARVGVTGQGEPVVGATDQRPRKRSHHGQT